MDVDRNKWFYSDGHWLCGLAGDTMTLTDLHQACERATKGPWEMHYSYDVTGYPCFYIHGLSGDQKRDLKTLEANVNYIALSREAIPKLLACIEAMDKFVLAVNDKRNSSPMDAWDVQGAVIIAFDNLQAARRALEA